MCTVTYLPTSNGAIITSNRDESICRMKNLSPARYLHTNQWLTYPKDEKGNGTWIGCNENNGIAVLLNGAFTKHQQKPPYKHSRGLIIPTILQSTNPAEALELMNLKGIEPFTIIIYFNNQLSEYRWDEHILHITKLNTAKAYCWNSATLYDKTLEEQNNSLLLQQVMLDKSAEAIVSFHQNLFYEKQLPQDSLTNNIKTISISQIAINNEKLKFTYYDLLDKQ